VTRAEWVSILAEASPERLAQLVAVAERHFAVEVTRPPAQGLLLATVEESVEGSAFHPGEILVTTCEVRVNRRLGYAIILGDDADKARASAVLDAALQGEFPEREEILDALAEERRRLTVERHAERETVYSTRVHFDTLEPQR
jgi:alpha-D-ribose 1-methylphosphonate 5-triphosphate synthase subunit PhnG